MSEYTTLVDPASGRSWRVPNNRLFPWHTLHLLANRWHIAHPITCDLPNCEYDAQALQWTEPPDEPGTYRWDETGWEPMGVTE